MDLAAMIAALAVVARYLTEWAVGRRLQGNAMRLAVVVVAEVLLAGVWLAARQFPGELPELAFMSDMTVLAVLGAGLPTGFLSYLVHDALPRKA